MKLSVVIICKNEAPELRELLPTLTFADEVLVIDDDSSDDTVKTASAMGARVITHPLRGDYASQRNLGLDKARGEWVLFLDADERLPAATAAEIAAVIRETEPRAGYALRRVDTFMGKALRHGETGNLWLVRLGQRQAGRWRRPVHEVWDISQPGRLKHPLQHFSHPSVQQLATSVRRYAALEADFRRQQGEAWSIWTMIAYPVGKWLRNMIVKAGILDGVPGWVMNIMMSYHSYLVRKYLYDRTYGAGLANNLSARVWRGCFYLTLVLLPLGQLTRLQISRTTAVYGFEILMTVQVLISGWQWWRQPRKRQSPPYSQGLLVLTGALLGSLVVNSPRLGGATAAAGLYLVRWLLYAGYWVSLWWAKAWGFIKIPYATVMRDMGIIWALLGWGQYLLMPDMRWLYAFGWDDHYYRLIGTIFDPGFLGLLLVLTLLLIELSGGRYRWGQAIVVFSALLLTYARSAYLILALVWGCLAARTRSWRRLAAELAVLAMGILLLPRPGGEGVRLERTYSISARVESAVTAWDVFKRSPLVGVGYNAYRFYALTPDPASVTPVHPSAPDNSYLFVLATSGVVGLAALAYFVGRTLWLYRFEPVIWISWLAILIHSLTNNTFFYSFALIWMGMLMGDTAKKRQ